MDSHSRRNFSQSHSQFYGSVGSSISNLPLSPSPALTSPGSQFNHFDIDLGGIQHHHHGNGSLSMHDSPMATLASNGASTLNGFSSGSGNGSFASTNEVVEDAWRRVEASRKADSEKNQLLEEIINRYAYVSAEYVKLLEQVEREKKFGLNPKSSTFTPGSRYEEDYENLNSDINDLRVTYDNLLRSTTRDPFILILIDGDGMIFHEHFLAKGEEGGRQAAAVLRSSADLYAREQMPDLPRDVKIIARMYANVRGLADACFRGKLVEEPETVKEFVKGFTGGSALFDFVDVGSGKDRADDKLQDMFKLHAYDARCKHIIFGCSHENGFARLLEKYIFDETITKRVTLLEGLPFGKELLGLPFNRSKFGTIFRSEKIVLPSIAPPTGTLRVTNGTAVVQHSMETAAAAALLRSMNHTPSESVSSMGDTGYAKPTAVMNWANRAAVAAALPSPPTPPLEKLVSTPGTTNKPYHLILENRLTKEAIPRNRKGQRIDPLFKHDKDEVERVRKMKMCNVHYLRGECKYGMKCTHKHDREPSRKDLEILKVVARYSCCRTGGSCDDPKCIYGHRCQAPPRMDPAKWPSERGKTCIFGPECAFPAELHNIDITPVKTTKV